MSSDQLTYVLVALIVTGVAILLLLAGALFARRGRSGTAEPSRAPDLPPPDIAPAAAVVPATLLPARPVPSISTAPPTLAAPQVPAPDLVPPDPVAAAPDPVAAAPDPVAAAPAPVAALPAAEDLPGSGIPPSEPEHLPEESGVTPADLEAAARRVHDPREQDVIEGFLSISPRRRETAAFDAPRRPTAAARVAPTAAVATAPREIPPDSQVDDITGLDSRAAWDRALAEENARYVRYRRPVGVIVAELDGLARFEQQFGEDASRRILVAAGGAMRRGARRTDRVAHVGGGRFMVLLPETDEIQAINYVERVRGECERWLDAGAVSLHVSMGWASPSAVGELDTALRTAEERMYAERRRAARAGIGDSGASR